MWVAASGVLALAYVVLPFAAGAAGVLGRPAPWWYVPPHWDAAYITGWEESGREGKPRITAPEEMRHPSS
jgi:hypothetical protein